MTPLASFSGPQSRSSLVLVAGLLLALGAAVMGCGPQKKFCADASDGVCPDVVDAGPMEKHVDAPAEDMGSIYVGNDASGN
jgi:hypothetical protein